MSLLFNSRHKSLLIRLLILIAVFFLLTNVADNRESKNEALIREIENETIGFELSDSLRQVRDSIRQVKDWKISRLRGYGNSMGTPLFGIHEIIECDSCNSVFETKFPEAFKKKYFIGLYGFTLRRNASFYIRSGKYYIQNIVWDTIYKNGAVGHPEEREIKIRYSIQSGDPKFSALLIPVSKTTYKTVEVAVWIFLILLILVILYVFLGLPINTLYSIANGTPFTKRNIRNLNIIGWFLIGSSILPPLLSLLIELILGNVIPDGIYYPFLQMLIENRSFLFAGLIVLLIAYAFKKGYRLQEEEDLTV